VKNNHKKLIEVKDVCVRIDLDRKRTLHAVNNVTFDIFEGETLGLVGESGCGKTTLGRVIKNIYTPFSGEVLYEGQNVHKLKGAMRMNYFKVAQMIFQDPYSSLDPRMTVREIVKEGMRAHKMGSGTEMNNRVDELLEMVGLSREQANRFPHEFSGGQRQRIGIARALATNPKFIVCDEPTSALDVSIQAQVITLLNDLQKQLGLTYLFISHDLAMVKYISNRVAVMYLGEIVEIAPSEKLYEDFRHPYTRSLLSAIQIPDPDIEAKRERIKLEGEISSLINPTDIGCKFEPRCPFATADCKTRKNELSEVSPGHFTACQKGR